MKTQEQPKKNARILTPSRIDDGGECVVMEILTLVAAVGSVACGVAIFLI